LTHPGHLIPRQETDLGGVVSLRKGAKGGDRGGVGFLVYVEGPRDRDILVAWARRVSSRLQGELVASTVILGGRQPARAAEHLRGLRQHQSATCGICVLDRDGDETPEPASEPGLEFFTWGRRHIESYLLVPDAIRRGLRIRDHDGRFDRLVRAHLPALDDERAMRGLDAKQLLGRKGPLARFLSRPVAPGRIARAMRSEELHPDVRTLFARIQNGLGLVESEPVVTVRRRSFVSR
jgi:hypothetical protein